MNVIDFGDDLINLHWVMNIEVDTVNDPDSGVPFDDLFKVTFYFLDGRGTAVTVKVNQEGLDTIREAMV